MHFISHERSIQIYDIVLEGPLFWSFSAADAEAGFALHPGLTLEAGPPEPAPADGSVFDVSTMTPLQRNAYIKWFPDPQEPLPPLWGFYDQMLHTIECHLLFGAKHYFMTGIWLQRILKELSIKDDRNQLSRATSLAYWAALRGGMPGCRTHRGPWLSRKDLNATLSAHLKDGSPIDARLAERVGRELLPPGVEVRPVEDSGETMTQFEHEFKLRWPKGFPLEQPDVSFQLIHAPGHPYTAAQIRGKLRRLSVPCWNFFADPKQFDPIVQLMHTGQQVALASRSRAAARKRKPLPTPST